MVSRRVFTLSVAASLLVGGGVASAAVPHTTSVKACVDHAGSLSLLVKGKCASGAHLLTLNTRGVAGRLGHTGAAGAVGPTGPAGPTVRPDLRVLPARATCTPGRAPLSSGRPPA